MDDRNISVARGYLVSPSNRHDDIIAVVKLRMGYVFVFSI